MTKTSFFDRSLTKTALRKPSEPTYLQDKSGSKSLSNHNAIGSYCRERTLEVSDLRLKMRRRRRRRRRRRSDEGLDLEGKYFPKKALQF
jgi:hypothetical protein